MPDAALCLASMALCLQADLLALCRRFQRMRTTTAATATMIRTARRRVQFVVPDCCWAVMTRPISLSPAMTPAE
jgi:hypothetical protein